MLAGDYMILNIAVSWVAVAVIIEFYADLRVKESDKK